MRLPQHTWLIGFFLLLAMPRHSSAQLIYTDEAPICRPGELDSLLRSAQLLIDSLAAANDWIPAQNYIKEIGRQKYLLPDGTFYVYEWRDSRWINLYYGNSIGYNHGSQKFTYGGDLYSFGGYGYWRLHGDLIRFIWNRHEWELVPYDEYQLQGNGPVFVKDSLLFVIQPTRFQDGLPSSIKELDSYSINLNTRQVRPFAHPELFPRKPYSYIETANYVYLIQQPAYILNKAGLSFYSNPLNTIIDLAKIREHHQMIHVTGDQIRILSRDLQLIKMYDLEAMLPKFSKIRQGLSRSQILLIAGIAGLLLFGVFAYRTSRRNRKAVSDETVFEHPLVNSLLTWVGQSISSDQLDELFSLQDIRSAETLRYKRAQLINSVNMEYRLKTGQKLVIRVQDPEDKRKYFYRIG